MRRAFRPPSRSGFRILIGECEFCGRISCGSPRVSKGVIDALSISPSLTVGLPHFERECEFYGSISCGSQRVSKGVIDALSISPSLTVGLLHFDKGRRIRGRISCGSPRVSKGVIDALGISPSLTVGLPHFDHGQASAFSREIRKTYEKMGDVKKCRSYSNI